MNQRDPRIAIILPAYNEAQTIAETIVNFHRARPDAVICVVDNNSKDGTAEKAEETFGRHPNCRWRIIREHRQGKAFAIRRAFTEIEADIFVMADADTTYDGGDLAALLAPVLAETADMVVGDRHSAGDYGRENKRMMHNFGNRLVRDLINVLFRTHLFDILSGYRVFTRTFVKSFPILSGGFELETELTLHALDKRFRIVEMPVRYHNRPAGSASKLSTFRDGARVLTTIFSILRYNKPLFFFSAVAAMFALAGLGVGLIPLIEFFRTHLILHLPSAILATGLIVCGFVMLAIALVLDSVARIDRQNFELRLISLRSTRPSGDDPVA